MNQEEGREKPQEVTSANETKNEKGEPRVRPPFIARGSARRSACRSALFAAPPPFEKLPKKGRSSLPTASHRASTNRERAAPPRFCHTSLGETGGKNPRRLRKSFYFPRAFSDGFRRGNRRSVVCGGWRS